jgi:hypothetical protein
MGDDLDAAVDKETAPFTDDVYDEITLMINTLSSWMKSGKPINAAELADAQRAVEVICSDLKGSSSDAEPTQQQIVAGAPAEYVGATETLEDGFYIPEPGDQQLSPIDEADPNSPFAPLHGLKNTWQVKGMQDLSTEEYYAAIYRRNRDMKDRRMKEKGYTREAASDYINSLSSNKKQE